MSSLSRLATTGADRKRSGSAVVRACAAGFALAGLLLASGPLAASAHETENGRGHSLEVVLSFPDSGLAEDEQICLGIYPEGARDFEEPPLQARCLDPGDDAVLFEDLAHGPYIVAVPGVGSRLTPERYQGQLVETSIPDEPTLDAFGIDVALDLTPEHSGTRGKVEVKVFGCPAGTDGGGDAEAWAGECQAVASGIPVSLSGKGANGDTALAAVTGEDAESGKVEFTNLPAGAYELGSLLPNNVGTPAVFIQSSIEGGVRPIEKGGALAVRPAETVAVDVYLVIDENAAATATSDEDAPLAAFADPAITGGLTPEQAAEMDAARDGS